MFIVVEKQKKIDWYQKIPIIIWLLRKEFIEVLTFPKFANTWIDSIADK